MSSTTHDEKHRRLIALEVEAAQLRRELGADPSEAFLRVGDVDPTAVGDMLATWGRDLLTLHGPDGRYLYASPASEKLFGWTPDELIGRSSYDFFHPDDVDRITAHHTGHLGGGSVKPIEYRYRCADGIFLWVETSADIAEGGDGIAMIVAFTRDVHDRKEAEFERERLTRELEDRLREIRELRGLIPICSYCKSVRDDEGYWETVEAFAERELGVRATHGICPSCEARILGEIEG